MREGEGGEGGERGRREGGKRGRVEGINGQDTPCAISIIYTCKYSIHVQGKVVPRANSARPRLRQACGFRILIFIHHKPHKPT